MRCMKSEGDINLLSVCLTRLHDHQPGHGARAGLVSWLMLQVSPASRVLGLVLGPPWPLVAQHDTSSNYYATSLSILMCIILHTLHNAMYLLNSFVLTSVGFFSATVKNLILLTYLCRWLKAEQPDNIFKTKSTFLMLILMHTLDISPHKKWPSPAYW